MLRALAAALLRPTPGFTYCGVEVRHEGLLLDEPAAAAALDAAIDAIEKLRPGPALGHALRRVRIHITAATPRLENGQRLDGIARWSGGLFGRCRIDCKHGPGWEATLTGLLVDALRDELGLDAPAVAGDVH